MNRNSFLKRISLLAGFPFLSHEVVDYESLLKGQSIQLGFVTYLWGKDWDVPTLIKNLTETKIHGVELRVNHAHNVMPELTTFERQEVKRRFADSKVQLIGLGTNQQFDFPDPSQLKASIEKAKDFVRLSADVGGTGVKVKPNAFHKEVSHAKTLEQIGQSLNELAAFAADLGQQIRLEVHGEETQELPNMKKIMDVATHPNATVCWNCNPQDLNGAGFEANFNLVKNRFGATCHVRELNRTDYPYQNLLSNLVKMKYKGWVLLECHTNPADKIASLKEQRMVFDEMMERM